MATRGLRSRRLGVLEVGGARRSLRWVFAEDLTVSVLVDRPDRGPDDTVRLLAAFDWGEGIEAVKATAEDYVERLVGKSGAERTLCRPITVADLRPGRRPRAR